MQLPSAWLQMLCSYTYPQGQRVFKRFEEHLFDVGSVAHVIVFEIFTTWWSISILRNQDQTKNEYWQAATKVSHDFNLKMTDESNSSPTRCNHTLRSLVWSKQGGLNRMTFHLVSNYARTFSHLQKDGQIWYKYGRQPLRFEDGKSCGTGAKHKEGVVKRQQRGKLKDNKNAWDEIGKHLKAHGGN